MSVIPGYVRPVIVQIKSMLDFAQNEAKKLALGDAYEVNLNGIGVRRNMGHEVAERHVLITSFDWDIAFSEVMTLPERTVRHDAQVVLQAITVARGGTTGPVIFDSLELARDCLERYVHLKLRSKQQLPTGNYYKYDDKTSTLGLPFPHVPA